MTLAEVSPHQWRFLRLFLASDAASVRVSFTANGLSLGPPPSPFAYPAEADGVQGYIKASGEAAFRGQALNRTKLSLADLRELEPCWRAPLRELNDLGRSLARSTPRAKAARPRTFRQTQTDYDALDRAALALGRDASELIRERLADLLETYR